jgi:phosphatidate phosphatase APP1
MELYGGAAFVLIGDSTGSDPEVYAELKARHPQRVRAILVRLVDPDDAKGERLKGMRTFQEGIDAAMEAHGAGLFGTDPDRDAVDNWNQEEESVAK